MSAITTPPASPTVHQSQVLSSLITPEDLAATLDTTERTLAEWRINGDGPRYVRLGRRQIAYRPEAVDEWLLSREYRSTSEERDADSR